MGTNNSRSGSSKAESINVKDSIDETETDLASGRFCIIYVDLMTMANSMKGSEVKLMIFICQVLAMPSKGIIYLSANFKNRAVKATGYTERSINRAIEGLLKLRVILPMPDSSKSKRYHVNPLYIWKGYPEERVQAIRLLGLKSTALPKASAAGKKKARVKVKQIEVDLDASIRVRKGVVRALLKNLQRQLGYSDDLCKKFYEYYTEIVSEPGDEQRVMKFEQQELQDNRRFNWEYRLRSWHRKEWPDPRKKAEEQNRLLKAPRRVISHRDSF